MRSDERNGPSVLDRAFRLIDAFQSIGNELGLAELARRSGLPKATAYRLAGQLVSVGALERAGELYRLGNRLFMMGNIVARQRRLRDVALPFMQDLAEVTHELVCLGVIDGLEVLVIEAVGGRRQELDDPMVGTRLPLHCTALGKAILAHSGFEVVDEVVGAGLTGFTPRTIRSPETLHRELVTIAEVGVANDQEEYRPGATSIAAPLVDRTGLANVAISITGPASRFVTSGSAPAVRTTALAITRALGGHPWLE